MRELDTIATLLRCQGLPAVAADWRPLLFQQFHDILPGTSIPEVFDQAEPVWRRARRQTRRARDGGLQRLFACEECSASEPVPWLWMGYQPLARWSPLMRLPVGCWLVARSRLPQQPCPSGGVWVQLPSQQGVSSVALERSSAHQLVNAPAPQPRYPLVVEARMPQRWRISNGLIACDVNEQGLVALQGPDGVEQLAGPLRLCRYRDRGEFWDAWDLAADYRQHPLLVHALGPPALREAGPLTVLLVQRFQLGTSELRLTCDSEPTAPGSSSSPALTGSSAMNCCVWNLTSPRGPFVLLRTTVVG